VRSPAHRGRVPRADGRPLRRAQHPLSYKRPFAAGGTVPADASGYDGLILLGGGPYGIVSGHLLPSLAPELRLTRSFIEAGLPVVGIELGAVMLAVAAGGGAEEAPLRFTVVQASRTRSDALGGHLPERFPSAAYLRDRLVPPDGADILAVSESGEPAVLSLRGNCLAFVGHPGMKSGMAEDLIMEFAETPPDTVEALAELRSLQADVAEALTGIMVGIGQHTGWI
jgi:GMP synthase-like glutamine amidotransferase